MVIKKIPKRMCTGCMEMKPKKELLRIVRTKDGEVSIDFTGKKAGRGAYICKNIDCFEKSVRAKRLSKSLETDISDEIYSKLKDEIINGEG
ncbi:RNase P modulator RnpM [Clostridium pasteurianum]|uniref:Putative nucleic-acid-binding protein implicated in transcription termination n=1 Tax=Clostridium pasteurianum BC1 TaxID=86416 RepID=R4KA79_CLOPA|nr:YlxR family protein [Clostridium pasteurianum]AGK97449.1 putative nucleic-acid-binding protein implicated in transcription termination [Clostridium pasteurianum BC1]